MKITANHAKVLSRKKKCSDGRGTERDTRFVRRSGNLGNDLADVRAARASANGNALALIFILENDRPVIVRCPGVETRSSAPEPSSNGFAAN